MKDFRSEPGGWYFQWTLNAGYVSENLALSQAMGEYDLNCGPLVYPWKRIEYLFILYFYQKFNLFYYTKH